MRSQCWHVKALVDPSVLAQIPSGLPPAKFEKKLLKVVDLEDGQRRITSITKHPLPEDLEDDQMLQQTYRGKQFTY
jgi:hypothetical protein